MLRTLALGAAPELELEIDSAGTAGYHVGEPPDPRTRAAAARRGYDLTALRARIVEPGDFERFDLILAMDRENLTVLRRRAPPAAPRRGGGVSEEAPHTPHPQETRNENRGG